MTVPGAAGAELPCVAVDENLDALAEIISTAAHELRTPTTVIIGLAETLAVHRAKMSREHVDDTVRRIVNQGHRLIRLLDDLLDLSRIRSGRVDVELSSIALSCVFDAALAAAPPPPGHFVNVEIDQRIEVEADHDRLEQVLVNLLTNAYRYGGRHVSVDAHGAPGGAILTVSDDGEGIPRAQEGTLFEPFQPGAEGHGGLGLGLSIARGLVESFGGRIWYERNVPAGARFRVFLRAGEAAPVPMPKPLENGAHELDERRVRVLVVDDEPDVLFLLRVTLEAAGYEVEEATHGGAALDSVRRSRPDVVVTDLMMPVMDGRELIRTIRQEPETAHLPVVLLSASPNDISGADRVIRKPFSPIDLTRLIGELVGGRS
jgi:CheY-like chemotaxis protein